MWRHDAFRVKLYAVNICRKVLHGHNFALPVAQCNAPTAWQPLFAHHPAMVPAGFKCPWQLAKQHPAGRLLRKAMGHTVVYCFQVAQHATSGHGKRLVSKAYPKHLDRQRKSGLYQRQQVRSMPG